MRKTSILLLAFLVLLSGCINSTTENKTDVAKATSTTVAQSATKPTTPTNCDVIPNSNEKDSCYWNLVVTSRDGTLCGKIVNETIKERCLQTIAVNSKNAQMCDTLKTTQVRESCLLYIAISSKNASVCNAIGNDRMKASCVSGAGRA